MALQLIRGLHASRHKCQLSVAVTYRSTSAAFGALRWELVWRVAKIAVPAADELI